ncbi:MAG: XRE family transcriptional regulator [Bryobacterales bacterium]|nr:XRE family transcriptional regulator [Bryobacterales bacterium]
MIGERLATARRRAGLKQVDLAVALGERYNQSVISAVEHGQSSLRLDGAVRAAQVLGVSLDYLVGLTDDPVPATDRASSVEAPPEQSPIKSRSSGRILHFTSSGDAGAEDEFESVRRYDRRDLRLAAGSHSFSDIEPAAGEVRFRLDWLRAQNLRASNLALLDAAGDSMAPTIRDGDSVLVDESRIEPVHGRVFAMRTVDGPLVKRLRKRRDRWWADSDNQEHESRPILREDRLLGLVVWWAHTE